MIYTTPQFSIYFGDASDHLYPHEYLNASHDGPLNTRQPYASICEKLSIPELTFCHQIHSTLGYVATYTTASLDPKPFASQGDYLITQEQIALGVMTADCLPIILYDQKTHSVGMIHAGWRGMAAGVIEQTFARMMQTFGSKPCDMQVVFGPAARACCYDVTSDFKKHWTAYAWHDEIVAVRDGKLFCDLPSCAQRIVQAYGVDPAAIVTTYNSCTVCTVRYCSYRRDKERAGRQMTVVALRV